MDLEATNPVHDFQEFTVLAEFWLENQNVSK